MGKIKSLIKKVRSTYVQKKENYLIRNNIGKKVEVSIADLLCCNSKNGELFRYDVAVRYLAVAEYHRGSEKGFELYRKMQDKRMGEGFSDGAVERFKALIESYDKGGYDKESRILLDKNLGLIDGSHRIAMALYYGYKNISALIIDTDHPVNYSIDWFVENGFSNDDIDLVVSTSKDIMEAVMVPFACVIWAPAVSMADRIIKDLGYFGTVLDVQKYNYRQEEYKNIVRAIYAIDDIEKWKIEKKLENMEQHGTEVVAVNLMLKNPEYRIKASSGLPLSTVGERIKKAIRSKYKSEINNYFFDIILHIGDNMNQSEYMRDVFETKVNFMEMVSIFNKYNYAFVKTDVPYMPFKFPMSIPVGKDADMICTREEFSKIISEIKEVCKKYNNYNIVVLNEEFGARIRIQWGEVLVYQIDISFEIKGLKGNFIKDSLSTRQYNGTYYTLNSKYEFIYRAYEFSRYKSKTHHVDYMKSHWEDYDFELLQRYSDCNVEELL